HIPNDARALQLAAGTVTANQAPHNLAVTTVTQLDAPQAVAATLVPTDLHAQTLDTIFATTSSAVGQQGPEVASPVWASYFGGPGDDRLMSAAIDPTPDPLFGLNQLLMAGWQGPAATRVGLVGITDSFGFFLNGQATIGLQDGALALNGADVD